MPLDPKEIYDPQGLSNQGYRSRRKLDLVFIQDTTGSQMPYIQASIACCKDVCQTLKQSILLKKDDGLQLALLAFRDHEDDYLVKDFGGFTDKVDVVLSNLNSLTAQGGGDSPEAITSALHKALGLNWRKGSVKIAILITDAAPHGIGEPGDFYSDGDPGNLDPLHIANEMATRGITLLTIACEPTLSNYCRFAHDFYLALAQITGGSMLPLCNIRMLAPIIVGFALEQIEIDSLASEFKERVLQGRRNGMSEEEIANGLFNIMQGTKVYSLMSVPLYSEPKDADKYVAIWTNANDTPSARNKHKQENTPKISRVPDKFILPPGPPSEDRIPITMRNIGDVPITYSYRENGREYQGRIDGNYIGPQIEFYVNFSYSFTLQLGTTTKQVSRIFDMQKDWNLAMEFS